jgi:Fe-S cluster assembly protein SufD
MATATKAQDRASFIAYFRDAATKTQMVGQSVRDAAEASLADLDFPHKKVEAWKYTSVKSLLKQSLTHQPGPGVESIDPYLIPGLEADVMVFINERYASEHSTLQHNGDALRVAPISELQGVPLEVFEANFGQVMAADWDIFSAVNTAYAREGVVAFIPKGKALSHPVHIIHLTDGHAQGNSVGVQHRNLFVVGDGAEGKIVETFHSLGETGQTLRLGGTEVIVGQNAGLEHIRLQLENSHSSIIDRTEVHQAQDSRYHVYTLTFSGDLVRNSLVVRLKGANTHTDMYGAYLLGGEQHLDNWTQIHHEQPNCYSNELYKGMVDDESSAAFTGKIHVYQPAQKTNAYQSNRNIILSDTANIYTKPQLEIYADDVKCSHGATTGRIDREALFYLMARGIPEKTARMMMIHAFVMEVIDHISLEPVKDFVDALVEQAST